jgi:hypothetical protein
MATSNNQKSPTEGDDFNELSPSSFCNKLDEAISALESFWDPAVVDRLSSLEKKQTPLEKAIDEAVQEIRSNGNL